MTWQEIPATENVCAMSLLGDYVISHHHPPLYCVRYRPKGEHHFVGDFHTLEEAKSAVEQVIAIIGN